MIIPAVVAYLVSSAVILFAGVKLAKYGDQIAYLTGMGHLWVGTLLIGFATSLPEIVTTSSASFLGTPDIAFGNIFGSNIFNIAIIAFADLIFLPQIAALRKPRTFHMLTVMFIFLETSVVMLGLFIGKQPTIFTLASTSIVVFFIYILSQLTIFKNEKLAQTMSPDDKESDEELDKPSRTYLIFACLAFLILISGVTLAWAAGDIVTLSPISQSFMGNVFVALSTSLPELVTVFAAIHMQAYDLAIGDVLGSNLFNVSIIFFADLFFVGDIYNSVEIMSQLYGITFSMLMLSLLSMGIITKNPKKIWGTDILTWIILGTFGLVIYTFYKVGLTF